MKMSEQREELYYVIEIVNVHHQATIAIRQELESGMVPLVQ